MILNEYSKTAWINGASPDINKANLDNLEQGVYDVTAKAMELAAYETNAAASATSASASATAASASATSAAASAAVCTGLEQDVANPSYESIYNLAKVKDLNIVGYGTSITQGYLLPNYNGLDGEQQPKGLANFLNTFYVDLLRKTANFLDAKVSNFTVSNTSGTLANSTSPSLSYTIPNGVAIDRIFPYNATDGSILFNYFCKELVIWGLKSNLGNAVNCGCDVFIDDVLAGTIDQKSATLEYFHPYVFQANTEGFHKIELKNFKNTGTLSSGNLYFQFYGVSNRKHMLYNESHGGKDSIWGVTNLQDRVITKNPDVLLLEFGANDIATTTLENFKINMKQLINGVQNTLPNCKISMMNSVPDSNEANYITPSFLTVWIPEIYKIARLRNCRIIDSWNTLNAINSATWRIDNIHPNIYGHSVLKELIEKTWCPELLISSSEVISVDNYTTYSTTTEEVVIGTYDGKPLYRKALLIPSLPSVTTDTQYAHGISNVEKIMIGKNSYAKQGDAFLPLPFVYSTATSNIYIYATASNVTIKTGTNQSTASATIWLEFTKTTD